MELELRHLRVLCAIAETGSVTKAAAVLGLAQPALTAQLQRIERMLGGPLFERDRRGARPTALGELVLARARVLLPAVRRLQDEAVRFAEAGEVLSRYRIGAANGPLLGGLVHRLVTDHPHAQVTTHASWSGEELAELACAGRLDYLVLGACGTASPVAEAKLVWRTVAMDAVFVLLPARHRLAGRDEVDLADLAEAAWVFAPGDGCFAGCFAAACARAGFTPRTVFQTDLGSAVDLVEAGTAVALCQPTFRPVPGLVPVPMAGTPLRWRQVIGWHPDAPAAAYGDRMLGYALGAYADAVRRSPRYVQWLVRNPRFGAERPQ
ncbi:MAG TPA: LysR family transcriptional regulator [Micromonosporaceae bacterium]|nr:LysR family transcriptional regulator [Micromonosporaceae bacterium]